MLAGFTGNWTRDPITTIVERQPTQWKLREPGVGLDPGSCGIYEPQPFKASLRHAIPQVDFLEDVRILEKADGVGSESDHKRKKGVLPACSAVLDDPQDDAQITPKKTRALCQSPPYACCIG